MRKGQVEREGEDVFFQIRLRPELHQRLAGLAKENERTIAGEIRLAIREYIERVEAQEVAA